MKKQGHKDSGDKGLLNNYVKYSFVVIQAALIITTLTFIGLGIDSYFGTSHRFLVIFSLIATAFVIIFIIKRLI